MSANFSQIIQDILKEKSGSPLTPASEVEALLQDISNSAPTGHDLDTLDFDAKENAKIIKLLMNLEAEMDKLAGNDYKKCAEFAQTILEQHSKNLKIAIWLCLAWYKIEGLFGLQKGMQLIVELLNKYGDSLYPINSPQKIKLLQTLDKERRLASLAKLTMGDEATVYVMASAVLDGQAAKESALVNIVHKLKKFRDQSFTGEQEFLQKLSEEIGEKKISETRALLLKLFKTETKSHLPKYRLSETVLQALQKKEESNSVLGQLQDLQGEEFASQDAFLDKISLQIGDAETARLQPYLLTVGYLNISSLFDVQTMLARLSTCLQQRFAEQTPAFSTLQETLDQLLGRAYALIDEAEKQVKPLPATAPATTQTPPATISADAGQQQARAESVQQRTAQEAIPARETMTRKTETNVGKDGDGAELSVKKLKITFVDDADIAIKKALRFYFPKSEENIKISAEPQQYGLSRVYRWGALSTLPADKSVAGPNEIKQSFLQQAMQKGQYDTVISDIEYNFIDSDEFFLWLDGQRYAVQALEHKGDTWQPCAQEIKFQLARLLQRFPQLPGLLFADEKTKFASAETAKWLEEEVVAVLGGSSVKEKILPPVMGEDYSALNREYETACSELPAKFEENAKLMQEGIAGDLRKKGQFLRKLNLANYCYLAKHYSLAKVFFDELLALVEAYHIAEWEQALCVAVWQSIYLNQQKLLSAASGAEEKKQLLALNKELIRKISKYDVVQALKLADYNKEKGE